MTVMQIHSQEWLGTFSSAGNGETDEELQMVIEKCQLYLKNHQLEKGTVRLDGKYGLVGKMNIVQKAGLDYFVRGRDYRLLYHPKTQEALKEGVQDRWTSPDSNVEREVFDVGFLEDWTDGDILLKAWVIVTRRPHERGKRVKVGKLIDGCIYELFLTSHPVEAFAACDVLSLYSGRGGFEKVLGDENVEQAPERWCSRCAEGQEFWQIINQWVWKSVGLEHTFATWTCEEASRDKKHFVGRSDRGSKRYREDRKFDDTH